MVTRDGGVCLAPDLPACQGLAIAAIIAHKIPVLERTAMRLASRAICVVVIGSALAGAGWAQAPAAAASEDTGRSIAGGGITVPGWGGKVGDGAAKAGQTVKDAKLAPEGKGMRVTTGPALTYWNPKNVAAGDYTVSATFTEPKYMKDRKSVLYG